MDGRSRYNTVGYFLLPTVWTAQLAYKDMNQPKAKRQPTSITSIIINHHNITIHAPAPMMATVNKYIHDVSQENYYRQHLVSHASSPLPLLTLHDSRNSMSNHHTSPLNISLRQSTSHTHLQSRLRPPLFQEVFGRRAERERHCFQAGDEDTVC
jgi:hypothetical protein